MLTTRIEELEQKYRELFAREGAITVPTPLQEQRQRFLDYLLDEVLFEEHVFAAYSIIGSTKHREDGLVLKYESQPGYASMHEEVGNVSHYQFMAFQQSSPFPWLPDFLILKDKNTSEVRLYLVDNGTEYTPIPKIGTEGDLELSYEMAYVKYEDGSIALSHGGMEVKEITRSQLCHPLYIFKMDVGRGEEGRAFDFFYRGLQELTGKLLRKIDQLRGTVAGMEIDQKYRALQELVKRES